MEKIKFEKLKLSILMGRTKISIGKKKDRKTQRMIYYKRKKGLIKKCMELSLLCDTNVFLALIDHNQKYTFYSAKDSPNEFVRNFLTKVSKKDIKNLFTEKDVSFLFNSPLLV